MNEEMQNDEGAKEEQTPKKGPSHIAYQVREGAEGKSYFNKVGSAFAHRDGQGFNVILESMPINGRVTLRTPQERLDDRKQGKKVQRGKESEGHER